MTPLWGPPGGDPGQRTNTVFAQREPGSIITRIELCLQILPAEGDFEGRGEATEAIQLTTADSSLVTGTVQIFDDGLESNRPHLSPRARERV